MAQKMDWSENSDYILSRCNFLITYKVIGKSILNFQILTEPYSLRSSLGKI